MRLGKIGLRVEARELNNKGTKQPRFRMELPVGKRVHGLDLHPHRDESDGSGTVRRDRAAWSCSRSRTPPASPEAADFFTRSREDRGQKFILNFVFFVPLLFNTPASTLSAISAGMMRLVIEQQSNKATKSGLLQRNPPPAPIPSHAWQIIQWTGNSLPALLKNVGVNHRRGNVLVTRQRLDLSTCRERPVRSWLDSAWPRPPWR